MSDNSVFEFKNKCTYKGKGKYQSINDRKGVMVLVVGIELEGQLVDGFNANSSVLPLAKPITIEATLRFDPNRPDTMDMNVDKLGKLGFDGDDLGRLNPSHAEPFLFEGKDLFVFVKKSISGDSEVTYFNFVTPEAKENTSMAVEDVSRSEAAAEFRRLALERRRPSMAVPAASTSDAPSPFDGPAADDDDPFPPLPTEIKKPGKRGAKAAL